MKASRVLLPCVSPSIQQMRQKLFVSGDTTMRQSWMSLSLPFSLTQLLVQLTPEQLQVRGIKPHSPTPLCSQKAMYNFCLPQNLTTAVPRDPQGIGSRTPHRHQNPNVLKSITDNGREQCIRGFPTVDRKYCFQSAVGGIHGCETCRNRRLAMCLLKKSTCKWPSTVQTHVAPEPTVRSP